jgi:hypothetical protein
MNSNTLIEHIDIDTLYTIEKQREQTMADPEFQQWCKDLRIGIMYNDRESIHNANRMMEDWNPQSLKIK